MRPSHSDRPGRPKGHRGLAEDLLHEQASSPGRIDSTASRRLDPRDLHFGLGDNRNDCDDRASQEHPNKRRRACHDVTFRPCSGTSMEELGTSEVLVDWMGHEDGSVGARYSHVTDSMRATLMDQLTEVWLESLDARRLLHPCSPVPVVDRLLQQRAAEA